MVAEIQQQPMATRSRADTRAFYLLKSVNKAQRRYRLIDDGDGILVAVSGGKDSMTLLDLLHRRQQVAPENYRLAVGRVQTDAHCGQAVPTAWLSAWCAERQIPMVILPIEVAEELATTELSPCFRCTWNRRRALFRLADDLRCNKIAFGHHMDDIAETTLMNLCYSGKVGRMEPRLPLFNGRLVVIRPLALVEERDIADYARAAGYPIQGTPCPAGAHSRRATVKALLHQLESETPRVKQSINAAVERQVTTMKRLKRQATTDQTNGPWAQQSEELDDDRAGGLDDLL
jgi:tRNA(Ile)-lysidine synthase TilS/MesJ